MALPTKLSVINDALANTANNLATEDDLTADEGAASFEYDRASRVYDRELPVLLERHAWPFAVTTEALEQADEEDNPSNRFDYAYDWPYFALWLKKVEAPGGTPIPFEIIGRYICMDYDGADDDAPIATFVQSPASGGFATSDITSLFWEVLRVKIEVGILRSINEDYSEATRRDSIAEDRLLPLVRTRTDQQMPARRAFRSTMRERRRSGGGPSAL